MNHAVFTPIAPRQPPTSQVGLLPWLRSRFFDGWANSLLTLLVLAVLAWALPPLLNWTVFNAVVQADNAACRAAHGVGACWGVVTEKGRLILFGRYPYDEQWRPLIASGLLVTLLVLSCLRSFWRPALVLAWVAVYAVFYLLMKGGVAGLTPVDTERWGGLPLTLLLSSVSLVVAFPLAILLALGRQSQLPAIRTLCVIFIEFVRGVPLISVLFMASFLFPLFLPAGTTPDVLLRVLLGIALFAAAYLAETVRAGLQSVPAGQADAAASIGLGWWQTQRLVVLPQALGAVVPGLMNSFISIFKDSSLITIVSLYELTGSLGLALSGDPVWRPYMIEGYCFITAIYFVVCAAMSRYSLWVERQQARALTR